MQIKHHLLNLICAAAPENAFAQDAIEHAILTNQIDISGDFETDLHLIMSRYDQILDNYRQQLLTFPSPEREPAHIIPCGRQAA